MYRITTDVESEEQVAALPEQALVWFAELRAALEVGPWDGDAYDARSPDLGMRTVTFGPNGEGLVVYLILERERRVDLLRVYWC